MNRKPVQEWMILLTYLFVLILLTVHSGYLCQKVWFVSRQFWPLISAGILAFVLNRPYKYVQHFYEKKIKLPKKISRISGLLSVYLGVFGVVAATLRFALPRFILGLQQFMENRDYYINAFERSAAQMMKRFGLSELDVSPLLEGMSGYIGRLDAIINDLLPQMARVTTGVFRTLAGIGIIIVLSAYIIYDQEKIKGQLIRLYNSYMPERMHKPVKYFLITAIGIFDHFVVGQGTEAFILGALCFVGMLFLGLEYSGLVSLVVGITAFIPFFGAYIGGGLGAVLLLFISVKKAFTFLMFFIILQLVENNFIYPRVVGKRTGLPGLWVLASVTIGGGIFGVFGMIISVPAATFFYVMLSQGVKSREQKKTGQSDINRV